MAGNGFYVFVWLATVHLIYHFEIIFYETIVDFIHLLNMDPLKVSRNYPFHPFMQLVRLVGNSPKALQYQVLYPFTLFIGPIAS